jgi:hypothetical protein
MGYTLIIRQINRFKNTNIRYCLFVAYVTGRTEPFKARYKFCHTKKKKKLVA